MPVALEAPQRLAHRRAAGGEALGELLLDEPLAVGELAREQRRAQRLVDLVGARQPSASTARSKARSGGCVTPPPICPTPGCWCAIPVWTGGEMRVAATLRASMPRIAARPSG